MQKSDKTEILQRLAIVETKVNEIAKNHLPTIERRLDSIERTVWIAIGGCTILLIIINIALQIIF